MEFWLITVFLFALMGVAIDEGADERARRREEERLEREERERRRRTGGLTSPKMRDINSKTLGGA